tara:strand:+ start:107 stop:286 length:180 start_codon:yes stop_codon:yes gene_type:complete
MSIEDKLSSLYKDLEKVMAKRTELQNELQDLTTLAVKIQGAVEALEEIKVDSEQTKEEK